VLKLLNSAVANGTNNFSMNIKKMFILEIYANEAAMLKRTLEKAKGSASVLRKRHTHLSIVISDDMNDKKVLHKKISGKSKVKKHVSVRKVAKYVDSPKIKHHEEFPENETPIQKVSLADEVKIASIIEEKEENK
ncbi:MAG: hypothetical protein LBU40_03310, partial [Methanobrevibacter sp.]|nr:hypothetical protein [Methanobrevibacter sp.]